MRGGRGGERKGLKTPWLKGGDQGFSFLEIEVRGVVKFGGEEWGIKGERN